MEKKKKTNPTAIETWERKFIDKCSLGKKVEFNKISLVAVKLMEKNEKKVSLYYSFRVNTRFHNKKINGVPQTARQ